MPAWTGLGPGTPGPRNGVVPPAPWHSLPGAHRRFWALRSRSWQHDGGPETSSAAWTGRMAQTADFFSGAVTARTGRNVSAVRYARDCAVRVRSRLTGMASPTSRPKVSSGSTAGSVTSTISPWVLLETSNSAVSSPRRSRTVPSTSLQKILDFSANPGFASCANGI